MTGVQQISLLMMRSKAMAKMIHDRLRWSFAESANTQVMPQAFPQDYDT